MDNITTSALLALALGVSAPVVAAAPNQQVSRTIAYDDLNLATAHGQKQLEIRIKSAVRSVCEQSNTGTRIEPASQTKCKQDKLAQAKRKAEVAIAQYSSSNQIARSNDPIVGN